MSTPVLSDARTFFASDALIQALSDSRINYWISDITSKGMITEDIWGKLYFNGFLNILGHYLYFYECNQVSASGAILSSVSVAQLSKTFATSETGDPFIDELKLTKYGRIYLSLRSQLATSVGGLVCY